ncbi:MAG: cyclic nucleotide-binding domain-containing protein, partial [Alphaproteobacteria bacterium]|nr:cyclic nucleotide-binding domain-containing protein [Alphaproteobacteria bacterium]
MTRNAPRLRLASVAAAPKVDAMQDLPQVDAYESPVQTTLRRLAAFSGLRRSELLAAEAAGVEVFQVAAGELLMAQGERDRSVFILASGRVSVLDGDRTVAQVRAGELLGEVGFFHRGGQRCASVISVTPCAVVVFSADCVDALRRERSAAYEVLCDLALRMLAKRSFLAQRDRDLRATAPAAPSLFSRLFLPGVAPSRGPRPSVRDALRACPALRDLSGRAWRALSEAGALVELDAGACVPADGVVTLLVSGALERVVDARGSVSERQHAGQVSGLGGLYYPAVSEARLRAAEASWVLRVSVPRLAEAMRQDPSLAAELQQLV